MCISVYECLIYVSDYVLIFKCINEENFDALVTLLFELFWLRIIKIKVSEYFLSCGCSIIYYPVFNNKMFFMYNMYISIGLLAHIQYIVPHMKKHMPPTCCLRAKQAYHFSCPVMQRETESSPINHYFGMLQYQLYVHGSSCTP